MLQDKKYKNLTEKGYTKLTSIEHESATADVYIGMWLDPMIVER
jgi:hypothetical protein